MASNVISSALSGIHDKLAPLASDSVIVDALLGHRGLIITACGLAFAHAVIRYLRSPWRSLPPGPTGLPMLGSAAKLFDKAWLWHESTGRAVGDVVYLNVAGTPTIILNSQRAAADILDRRAAICSGRPRSGFIVGNELISGGLFFVFASHTPLWRRMRRAAHEAFKISVTARYHDMQAQEAVRLA
ncbi:hypothetical protein K488DRAFT_51336, partial [Vararia minispora EC-137]